MSLKDAGLMWLWSMLGIITLLWIYLGVKAQAEARFYWIGRRDGWNMHRRMIENKRQSDEVFDYDKN
jgi:hypothetical protein